MAFLRLRVPLINALSGGSPTEYTFVGIVEEITATEMVIVCVI